MLGWSLPGGQDHYLKAISELAAGGGFTSEKVMEISKTSIPTSLSRPECLAPRRSQGNPTIDARIGSECLARIEQLLEQRGRAFTGPDRTEFHEHHAPCPGLATLAGLALSCALRSVHAALFLCYVRRECREPERHCTTWRTSGCALHKTPKRGADRLRKVRSARSPRLRDAGCLIR